MLSIVSRCWIRSSLFAVLQRLVTARTSHTAPCALFFMGARSGARRFAAHPRFSPLASIHFSDTRGAKSFRPTPGGAHVRPRSTGPGVRPHPPPPRVRRNRRGVSLPSPAGVYGWYSFGGYSTALRAGQSKRRHVTPTRRVIAPKQTAPLHRSFRCRRSISPRRCSVSALWVLPRETSHLEAGRLDCYSRGGGYSCEPPRRSIVPAHPPARPPSPRCF